MQNERGQTVAIYWEGDLKTKMGIFKEMLLKLQIFANICYKIAKNNIIPIALYLL